jgi:inhibitor of cysteine peptidase
VKNSWILILSVFSLMLLLAACQSDVDTFTQEDNGESIILAVSDEILIKLEGNPTTGYTWELDKQGSSGVEQVGEPEYVSQSKAIGSGGIFTFRVKAVQPGEHTLQLKYWRTFEPDTPPIELYNLKLNITEK